MPLNFIVLTITPNHITSLRVVLALIIPVILLRQSLASLISALLLYILAALTDVLDGILARHRQQITVLGKLLDPIADKLLVVSAYASFAYTNAISWWWLVPIVLREVAVTFARFILAQKGNVIAAARGGKIKVILQHVSVFAIFGIVLLPKIIPNLSTDTIIILNAQCFVLLSLGVWATLQSGFEFFYCNRDVFGHYRKISKLIATGLGIGYIPILPGTCGSLVATLGVWALFPNRPIVQIISCILCLILGIFVSARTADAVSHPDPPSVIIDEICGTWVTFLWNPIQPFSLFLGFALFRFFDIFKLPWIRKIENIPNGFGIMLDDVAAGLLSNILLRLILLAL